MLWAIPWSNFFFKFLEQFVTPKIYFFAKRQRRQQQSNNSRKDRTRFCHVYPRAILAIIKLLSVQ